MAHRSGGTHQIYIDLALEEDPADGDPMTELSIVEEWAAAEIGRAWTGRSRAVRFRGAPRQDRWASRDANLESIVPWT